MNTGVNTCFAQWMRERAMQNTQTEDFYIKASIPDNSRDSGWELQALLTQEPVSPALTRWGKTGTLPSAPPLIHSPCLCNGEQKQGWLFQSLREKLRQRGVTWPVCITNRVNYKYSHSGVFSSTLHPLCDL